MINKKELRMYGFVSYNISPIQQAIQFGHAVVEYQLEHDCVEENMKLYNDWAKNWKTFIILNGGTTSEETFEQSLEDDFDELDLAGLQYCERMLIKLKIKSATFREPDLNNATTAVVFILDEEVFNYKKYPKYEDWVVKDGNISNYVMSNIDVYYIEVFGSVENGEYIDNVREFISKYRFA